jgi:hypothetical protein
MGKAMTARLTNGGTQARTTQPATPAGRGRLQERCHRIRLTIQEMNYASQQAAELQAPWSVDQQWQSR